MLAQLVSSVLATAAVAAAGAIQACVYLSWPEVDTVSDAKLIAGASSAFLFLAAVPVGILVWYNG
jgi:hypothetical protein